MGESITSIPALFRMIVDPGPLARGPARAKLGGGLLLLAARLWLAWPFLHSGMLRMEHWSSQAFLFEAVHPVPFLAPAVAAVVTTAAELILPVALALGVMARPAALGLAVMAAAIYFVIGQTPAGLENGIAVASEQFPWMAVGLALAASGAGALSIDARLDRRLARKATAAS
jgi:putative oxidoreductase